MNDLYLGAYWTGRPLTLAEYSSSVRTFLSELQRLHPIFKHLSESGRNPHDRMVLHPDLDNLEAMVLSRAYDPLSKTYTVVDKNGRPTLESHSATNYGMQFENIANGDQRIAVSIRIGAESSRVVSAVVITFPEHGPSEFKNPVFLRGFLKMVIQCWKPMSALVGPLSFNKLNMNPKTRRSISWLTYFADPRVAEHLPEGARSESFGPGGTLITIGKEIASAENVEDIAMAKRICETLTQRGFMTYEATKAVKIM